MKRRKALIGLSLLAGGSVLSFSGWRWVRQNTTANLEHLNASKITLAAVVDTIIPKTDSPSASECGVHEFVIKMITDCTDIKSQNSFIDGLKDLEKYSLSEFGTSFVTLSESKREQVLSYFQQNYALPDGTLGKVQKLFFGKPFFTLLREYCVVGYFTSEKGATQALRYSHIPSKYIACAPYTPGEKAWATN